MATGPGDFEQIARPHLDSVYRVALRLTGNRADAEDLIQDTYLRAYRGFKNLARPGAARTWLFKILVNLHRDRLRHQLVTGRSVEITEVMEAEIAPQTGTKPASETVPAGLAREEARLAVRLALESLPAEYRAVVLFVDVEDFSYREAAEALGCPIGTVMSRLYRGRQALRQKLQGYAVALGYVHPEKSQGEGAVDLAAFREHRKGLAEGQTP